jgi:hypothetical protein
VGALLVFDRVLVTDGSIAIGSGCPLSIGIRSRPSKHGRASAAIAGVPAIKSLVLVWSRLVSSCSIARPI